MISFIIQEKEYPDKVDQIKNLKQEMVILEQEFQAEYLDLEETAAVEKTNYKSDVSLLQEDIKAGLAEVDIYLAYKELALNYNQI